MIRRRFALNSFVPTFAPAPWTRLLLKSLGPGVITGAADDDPSGIATYSVAGAQLGTKLLWTALLTWPLMAAVQMMCARIGMVTGKGLAGNFKQRFPRWLLRVFIVALLAANTINIAADLAGMADAAEMLSGVKAHWFGVVFAILISWATVRLRYHQIANVLSGWCWCWCSSPTPSPRLWWGLILAPFLLVAILVVASDKKLMQGQPSSRLGWIVVAITTVAMFAAGIAMFVV